MTGSNGPGNPLIGKRDFDLNRPLLRDGDSSNGGSRGPSSPSKLSRTPPNHDNGDNADGLLNDVVDGIVERDRRKLQKEAVRICSFSWGVISW